MELRVPLVELKRETGFGTEDQHLPQYAGVRDKLAADGTNVKWYRNGVIIKQFSYPEPVVQTVFAQINDERDKPTTSAVVFLADSVYIYQESGGTYVLHMPFTVRKAMACNKGLVLERQLSPEDTVKGRHKFFMMTDPVLDLGVVVSSSTSAISASEELMYFGNGADSSLCATRDSDTNEIKVYHIRYLSRSSLRTLRQRRRSSSRRRSSLARRPQDETASSGDDGEISLSLEQRLSLAREELPGTGDGLVEAALLEADDVLDPSNMRKDAILTLLESFPLEGAVSGDHIKVFSIAADEQECLVVHDAHNKVAHLHYFRRSDDPVSLPSAIATRTITADDVADVDGKEGKYMLLLHHGDLRWLSPVTGLLSDPWAVPKEWGRVSAISASHPGAVTIEAGGTTRTVVATLTPRNELVGHCFGALGLVLGDAQMDFLRFKWAALRPLVSESLDEWKSLVVALLVLLAAAPENLSGPDSDQIHLLGIAKSVQASSDDIQMQPQERSLSIIALHTLHEELKLDISCRKDVELLAEFLKLVVTWAGWHQWAAYYESQSAVPKGVSVEAAFVSEEPPSVYRRILGSFGSDTDSFFMPSQASEAVSLTREKSIFPNLYMLIPLFDQIGALETEQALELMVTLGLTRERIDQYPEGLRLPLLEVIAHHRDSDNSLGRWPPDTMRLLEREDLFDMLSVVHPRTRIVQSKDAPKDIRQLTQKGDQDTFNSWDVQSAADNLAISRLLFSEDRRYYEVTKLLQTSRTQTARLVQPPETNEHEWMMMQQVLFKATALRKFSITFGRAALFYSTQVPLVTDKFPIPKLNFNVLVKPSNVTISMQKDVFTEQEMAWGYFHNGVSSGLSISKDAKQITASWIVFNKPSNSALISQHAGFLLGLGINGHLKKLEEWHIYNYLNRQNDHRHISIALLVGMAASKIGSMDAKLTKVLGIHVSALLPVGSADLNVPLVVQTAGIIGIGLLYQGTQHRRMTEVMLREVRSQVDSEAAHLSGEKKDEGYKLAAGAALGLINLGKGRSLEGFGDMNVIDNLLAIVASYRDVDALEVDMCVAGATIALMLMFLKSNNHGIAKKLLVPDTEQRLDYIRPDLLFVRVLTKHLVMWDEIGKTRDWVEKSVPILQDEPLDIAMIRFLDSDQMAYFNILGGTLLAVGLRYASTGDVEVRDTLIHYLKHMMRLSELPATNFDQSLGRQSLVNVQNTTCLALAAVMVGTGDLEVFRYLRRFYSRTTKDTTFGDFTASQMAMGFLFMSGGQCVFDTSEFAIASLVLAFYPLFPQTLTSNSAHAQVFRHFWAFAAVPRCLVVRDATTHVPTGVDVTIELKTGESLRRHAPCLLPSLDTIKSVRTNSVKHHPVTISLADPGNELTSSFMSRLTVYVATRTSGSADDATLESKLKLASEYAATPKRDLLQVLARVTGIDGQDLYRSLEPSDAAWGPKMVYQTAVDLRLSLGQLARSPRTLDDLSNLRLVFIFAEAWARYGRSLRYLSLSEINIMRMALWSLRSTLAN